MGVDVAGSHGQCCRAPHAPPSFSRVSAALSTRGGPRVTVAVWDPEPCLRKRRWGLLRPCYPEAKWLMPSEQRDHCIAAHEWIQPCGAWGAAQRRIGYRKGCWQTDRAKRTDPKRLQADWDQRDWG